MTDNTPPNLPRMSDDDLLTTAELLVILSALAAQDIRKWFPSHDQPDTIHVPHPTGTVFIRTAAVYLHNPDGGPPNKTRAYIIGVAEPPDDTSEKREHVLTPNAIRDRDEAITTFINTIRDYGGPADWPRQVVT